jgi:hypothetical protein
MPNGLAFERDDVTALCRVVTHSVTHHKGGLVLECKTAREN